MREPQEIRDGPGELAVTRVAAVDVAKASGVVCTRVPRDGEPGRFVTRVWPVEATTNAILELAGYLAGLHVDKVVLESTSDYWRPFFYLLEAAGLNVEHARIKVTTVASRIDIMTVRDMVEALTGPG